MKEQPELTVYEVETAALVPYVNNAKVHTREQVEQIAASIEEFGFNDPIAAWHNAEGELEIVEGHGRVMAAKKLGIEVLPVVYLDHLSDEQRRAYTHVHNQLTMTTEFDLEILNAEIEELDFQFEDFGFDVQEEFEFDSSMDVDSVGGMESDVCKIVVGGKSYIIGEDEQQMILDGLAEWCDNHVVTVGYFRSLYEAARD